MVRCLILFLLLNINSYCGIDESLLITEWFQHYKHDNKEENKKTIDSNATYFFYEFDGKYLEAPGYLIKMLMSDLIEKRNNKFTTEEALKINGWMSIGDCWVQLNQIVAVNDCRIKGDYIIEIYLKNSEVLKIKSGNTKSQYLFAEYLSLIRNLARHMH